MNPRGTLLSVSILLSFVPAVAFAEPPPSPPVTLYAPDQDSTWKRYTEEDGITTFVRKKEGSNIKEAIGKGVVDAPPCHVFQVIRDSDRLVEFMPYLEARILKHVTPEAEYVCEYLDFPWPIWDRVVNLRIAEVRNHHENQCEYLVHWRKDETHACTFEEVKEVYQDANPHAIVPPAIDGYWQLLPQDGGKKTLAYYYGFTDPGGKIPDWLNNAFVDAAILKLFRAVRKRAGKSDLYPPCQCSSSPAPDLPAFEME